jgi:hypothetical protein
MLHTELPFVTRAGFRLENFAQKNSYLWNCSCPICGDLSSTTNRKKKRFYIYRPGAANHLNAKCHKCGYSTSFGSFLKQQFPDLFKEFVLEQYHSTSKAHVPHKNLNEILDLQPSKKYQQLIDKNTEGLKPCATLKPTHPVAKFLSKRQIPQDKWELLYYTTQFMKYTNGVVPGKFPDTKDDHPRLVIPFLDEHGKMYAYQGRAFGDEQPRYYTMKLDDRERIYGLDRLDTKFKKVYAVEGPLDSLFLPNCIAVSGSNFDCETVRALKSIITLIPDNEPRSKEIVKLIKKHIDLGYKVCMLPHSITSKDINEMILSGITSENLIELIDKNTFQGAAAQIRFAQWKMI